MSQRTGWLGGVVGVVVLVAAGCDDGPRVRAATGELEPGTRRLSFGATTLGMSVRRDLLLAQRGLLAAEVTGLRLDPDEGAYEAGEVGVVARDASAPLEVRYRPVRAGRHREVLVLELLDGAPVRVALEGEGVDARAVADVPVVLGRPALGAVRRRSLVLRNDARTAVPAQLAVRGAEAAELDVPPSVVLAPFSALEVPLRWEPEGRAGPRDLWIELVACPLCAPERLDVVAEAVATPLVVTPDPVQAGGVGVDGERRVRVSITNATDELIDVTGIALGGETDIAWSLEAQPGPLAPLATMEAVVTCTPTRLGAAKGTLVIASDAEPVGDRVVPLAADAGGAQLVVAPARLDFRATPTAGRSELVLVVANGGADPAAPALRLDAIASLDPAFRVVTDIAPGTLLAAGERLVVRVAFAPAQVADFAGVLEIRSSDASSPTLVALSGRGAAAADCRLVTTPPAIAFGSVRPGRSAMLVTRIENAGTEPCAIWDTRVEGDPAFALARDRAFVTMPPGSAVNVPVRFTPTTNTPAGALLRLDTSDPRLPELLVPLSGGSLAACLRAEPASVDFGRRRLDCGPAERVASWRNACPHAIDVTGLFAGPAPDRTFSLSGVPALPVALAPDARVEATVRFAPVHVGWTAAPLFAQADDPLPILITATADVSDLADHVESFVQPTPGRVDVLLVVDNTASMADERAGLARAISSFLAAADARGIDYRIGVTTTGVGPPQGGASSEACPGGADGAESGRLFPVDRSRPRIVTRLLPDRARVLAANLEVGGCHNVEQGLEAARRALSAPLATNADDPSTPPPEDGNLGLLRPDAALAIVVVSDEDDESPGAVADRIRLLRRVKPTSPMTLSAIVAPDAGCASAVEPGRAYAEAARRLGGVTASICDEWGRSLETLADDLFGSRPRTRFALAALADPASLVVSIDGAPAVGWTYDRSSSALVFASEPPPASLVEVRYREPCP